MTEEVTCPSAPADVGARVLGVVGDDGVVRFLGRDVEVDDALREAFAGGPDPRRRLRFASPCISSGCAQWTCSQCRVGALVASLAGEVDHGRPDCGVRASCRCHRQHGDAACRVCPEVVTDRR